MELRDNSQRLTCRPLYNDGPAGVWDRYGAEEPVLAIGPRTYERSRVAPQRLVGARQLIQHCLQDPFVLRRSDKFAAVIDDADHEPPALALLRLDHSAQGVAEFS